MRSPFALHPLKDEPPKDNEQPALAAPTVDKLCNLELIFVTGKGGVGKTSVSGVIALCAAARGKRVLLVYPGAAPPARRLWNADLNEKPLSVAPGIDAIAIHPEVAMRQYVGEVLGSTKLAALVFHHRVARGLLTGIPGPSDWAVLGKAWSLTRTGAKLRAQGDTPYDLVILDAPASGDGSGMLRVPQVILDLAPAARLRADAASCLSMLQDEKKSAVVFVTLVEELSLAETEENLTVVRQDLKMPIGPVFVNQVLTPRFSPIDRQSILSGPEPSPPMSPHTPHDNVERCREIAYVQAMKEDLQQRHLKRVENWRLPTVRLALLPQESTGTDALKKLQMTLAEGH